MKKLLSLLFIILGAMTLFACDKNDDSNPITHLGPTIVGAQDVIYYIGDDLPNFLEGVQAFDDQNQEISSRLVVNDDAVNYDVAQTYQVFIEVTDFNGLKTTIYIYVIVLLPQDPHEEDSTPPVLVGYQNITYEIGDDLPNYLENVTAYDNVDGPITEHIQYEDHLVNYEVEGVYEVVYTVSDQQGNKTTVTILVTVKAAVLTIDHLNIYYINDVHGAILEDGAQLGFSNMASLILSEKENNPDNTLFISGGDLLQGNIMSNYFYGESMIDLLNAMSHDAFIIGNHEFDWGLEVATRFLDPEYDGIQANFPMLGANIFHKGTKNIPNFIKPYEIIEKGQIKVGIIGLMGYGLERSIATSRIRDYEFGDPYTEVVYYTEYLRTQKDVDVVLVVMHGADEGFNQSVGALSGNRRVDAVFNGHSHSAYTRTVGRLGTDMPVIQSGGNGSHVGHLRLQLNASNRVSGFSASNLNRSNDARLLQPHPSIEMMINSYLIIIDHLINESIIKAGSYLSRAQLTLYMSKLMRVSTDSVIGFHNSGGTRADIDSNQDITVATLYQVFPFDNRIKTTYLKGEDIIDYANRYGNYDMAPHMSLNDLEPNTYYKVATNDYLFDMASGPFVYGIDEVDTGILIRDLFESVLRQQAQTSQFFYLSTPIVVPTYSHNDRFIQ